MNFFEKKMFPTAQEIDKGAERVPKISAQEKALIMQLHYNLFNLSEELENEIKLEDQKLFTEIQKIQTHLKKAEDWFTLTSPEKRMILVDIGYSEFEVNSVDSELNDYYLHRLLQIDGFVEMYDTHTDKKKRVILRDHQVNNFEDWMTKTADEKVSIVAQLGFDSIENEKGLDEKMKNVLLPYLKMN